MSSASRHVAAEEGMRMCQADIVIYSCVMLLVGTSSPLKLDVIFALFRTSEDFEYHLSD